MPRSLLRVEQRPFWKRRLLAPIDKSKLGLFNPFSLEHDPKKVGARQTRGVRAEITRIRDHDLIRCRRGQQGDQGGNLIWLTQ